MDESCFPPLFQEDVDIAVQHAAEADWKRLSGHRFLVTGGTGFVGKWFLAALLEAQRRYGFVCETTVLSRNPKVVRDQVPWLASGHGIRLLEGNVLDFDIPDSEFDTIVHAATDVAASLSPLQTFDTCFIGTRRVLELATRSGARNFLLVSSGAVYGRQPAELAAIPEDFKGAPDTMSPSSGYGQGKRAAEWLAAAWAAEHDMRLVTARLFAFMGPGMPLNAQFAAGNFMRAALAGEPIVIEGDGTPLRSYLHAADMAGWLWQTLFRGKAGAAYNIGGDEVVTIAELAQRVCTSLEAQSQVEVRGKPAPGLSANRYVPDVSKARLELGLVATLTLDESIQHSAQWYRASS